MSAATLTFGYFEAPPRRSSGKTVYLPTSVSVYFTFRLGLLVVTPELGVERVITPRSKHAFFGCNSYTPKSHYFKLELSVTVHQQVSLSSVLEANAAPINVVHQNIYPII